MCFYSSKIPPGAVEKEVDLAHGTKIGYVKDGDITFVVSRSEGSRGRLTILNLGRIIKLFGVKVSWSSEGAYLTLPGKRRLRLPVPLKNFRTRQKKSWRNY